MPERPARRVLAVIDPDPAGRGPDRGFDRRLTVAGLGAATAFLAGGLASLALPPALRLGTWLPLHLVLAGGAGTAIAAMLPFFSAALTVAPPAPPRLRVAAILATALGALMAAVGRALSGPGSDPLAAAGAGVFVIGAFVVLLATLVALRGATGPRRPATEVAYIVGLVEVVIGVALAALFLAGSPQVAAQWAALKPAHAWLNLFGFVAIVVAGTLAHFAPTVAGARIGRRRWAALAVAGLGAGAPVVALGYGTGADLVARLGAALEVLGALALAAHGWQAHRARFAWTTDHAWHAFTSGSLLAAPAWLVVATAVAAVRIGEAGADPSGWQVDGLLAPLIGGFVVQALLGALSHLLPAIGPGSPERHAIQRRILGRDGRLRLGAWNVGVALATSGVLSGLDGLADAGLAILVATFGATLILLGTCLAGRR
ncbi:MAG TPA: hypothetical protein VJ506_04870 [Candidatus Limnocylindrales bacterium]|nr:hypothetical protein [Candidatus Limnocylindrales bacterium]